MTTILKKGNEYDFTESFENLPELKPGHYLVNFEPKQGRVFLTDMESAELPTKIYGNDTEFINHAVTAYTKGSNSMGICLTGIKGLGKTFTAKVICTKLNLPVIHITQNAPVFDLLNKINQPHIIFIDEFEKIFPVKSESMISQEDFLSYLDGATSTDSKKLFMITTNEEINAYLLNRPSRLRYIRSYNILSMDIVREIITDLLVNKDYQQDLLDNIGLEGLNIDTLIKIIEEINLMDMPYSAFKSFFNFKVEKFIYTISLLDENFNPTQVLGEIIHNADYIEWLKTRCNNRYSTSVAESEENAAYVNSLVKENISETIFKGQLITFYKPTKEEEELDEEYDSRSKTSNVFLSIRKSYNKLII